MRTLTFLRPDARRAAARCLRAWPARSARPRRVDRAEPCDRGPHREGFTLVELMVVIVIIGLLATVVAINVLPSQDRAMTTKAKADIATLEQAIETYRLDNLDFPADLQALVAAPAGLADAERYRPGGYVRRLPEDPWGEPYQYRRPGAHGGPFDVFSYGADRKEGGEGDDADLGNWQV
ncbi:MAG: type II secretion system major pseudopilin GspG [Alphaproteobacteria bacterium]|nr:type II secretion system protein GspG [Brevundimonas sp.]MBU3969778.1 type II secretion system major pseudopilin GspG [Alphaproteobacteria bacterium]MBU3972650.1 type II secretion system major pseudopilin GspG [Alphaproteobacteria bacterium]MBU4039756.1 type II secretion system major pseudopilin GspG [Alphaproteobacteria bacterium]